VIAHKDRLLRFGAELVFATCEAKNVEVVILNQGEETSFEQDLATDVWEMITIFNARLYGTPGLVATGRVGRWRVAGFE
jgi:predicted site-specific integrase-resolvase